MHTLLAPITLSVSAAGLLLSILLLVKPGRMRRALTDFPRHANAGRLLSAIGFLWSGWLLYHMPMGMLDVYKPVLLIATPVVIGLTWIYLDELLASRALGGLFLLVPAPWLAAARLHPSPWRVVASCCAYAMVAKGLLLLLAPYQFRWGVRRFLKTDLQSRLWGAAGVFMYGLLVLLAVIVYG